MGTALAGATRAIAVVRPADKPLHPSGGVVSGVLERDGAGSRAGSSSGAAWLDEAGEDAIMAETVLRLKGMNLRF